VSEQDTLGSTRVAVVNEAFVRKLIGTAEPLGKVFRVESEPGKPEPVYEIIGVVKDTKYAFLREDFLPIVYPARAQDPKPDSGCVISIRSAMLPSALLPEVERTITKINPSISIQFSVFKTQIRDSLQRELLMASLSGFFGVLAAILATVGLYGVVSYMVVRRRSEIGIRMALGADRLRVLAMVMREAVILLAVGLVVGGGLAWFSGKAARTLLFGLTPQDPVSLVLAALLLAVVAVAASYIPAFRASRVNPLDALREE
jgi:putative ABC transport system permease protein